MKKFVEDLDTSGVGTGNYKLQDATVLEVVNPMTAVDSTTSIVRALSFALLGAMLS